ncbi:MAG: biotin/lipoyl-containing protein [Bacteroidota bacterium]
MKKFKFTIQGNPYDVEILSIEDNQAEVLVNGTVLTVDVDKTLLQSKTPKLVRTPAFPSTDSSPSVAKTNPPGGRKGSGVVKSPLPGTIIALNVAAGDAIKIGQKLLVLEAMKMENNINSDKEGTVSEINVKKGDTVMEGQILMVIS